MHFIGARVRDVDVEAVVFDAARGCRYLLRGLDEKHVSSWNEHPGLYASRAFISKRVHEGGTNKVNPGWERPTHNRAKSWRFRNRLIKVLVVRGWIDVERTRGIWRVPPHSWRTRSTRHVLEDKVWVDELFVSSLEKPEVAPVVESVGLDGTDIGDVEAGVDYVKGSLAHRANPVVAPPKLRNKALWRALEELPARDPEQLELHAVDVVEENRVLRRDALEQICSYAVYHLLGVGEESRAPRYGARSSICWDYDCDEMGPFLASST